MFLFQGLRMKINCFLTVNHDCRNRQLKIHFQKLCDIKLGTVLLPKVEVTIDGLSKEEEKLFNEIFMRSRGGG
ncbi:hypothetical protein DRH29_05260 [candidate division Kazan bacterium]|uniref:Uncharacterized protein n=1 Tax=candidate division Kazan bacterium TaxID=2202143 RepID=A0A420ZB76_UNCK3|nr:MAG: hypothetical protein DRH29_05260 [candidate division Kazan bacterium]